ncbi:hypothetical protein SAMN04488602_12625 [Paenibacillus sp. cl123]|nr:hypothetical protein SAMN04488602_12625 [Paenibacillus sp. cl123]
MTFSEKALKYTVISTALTFTLLTLHQLIQSM